ncbi:unnamed protein product [Heligmosomoides polygyrus]|uniref:NAD(P)-binding protein n=1 Tax=Heligmosomoides polygyrus TaxID=6339 RepID=A0A183GH49_HELPZ|nr:unnamed protein product [Heligmosomoides polygyrus]
MVEDVEEDVLRTKTLPQGLQWSYRNQGTAMATRRVLITGASSGIGAGLSLAEQLCNEGHQVTITVRDDKKAASTMKILSEKQVCVDIVQMDFSIWSSVVDGVNEILRKKMIFDIVIFNAGTMFPDEAATADGVETCFQVDGVTAVAVNPGNAVTNVSRNMPSRHRKLLVVFKKTLITVEEAAANVLRASLHPLPHGKFYDQHKTSSLPKALTSERYLYNLNHLAQQLVLKISQKLTDSEEGLR